MVVNYTIGQYLDIDLTVAQYGIYCPGGSFDLYNIGRISLFRHMASLCTLCTKVADSQALW